MYGTQLLVLFSWWSSLRRCLTTVWRGLGAALCHVPLCLLLAFALSSTALAGDKLKWYSDLPAATEMASTAHKDLLVVFTGRGWCQPCELLVSEVFDDSDFVRYANRHFVPVELDYGNEDRTEDPNTIALLADLKRQYLVTGYPTIVLRGTTGPPYAVLRGYDSEKGKERVLETLREAVAGKKERDRHFQMAEEAVGAKRIQHLYAGLLSVEPYLGTMEDGGDDPLLFFYEGETGEILESTFDACQAARGFLLARVQKQEDHAVRQAIDKRIGDLWTSEEYERGLSYVDALIADEAEAHEKNVPRMRMLQMWRLRFLEKYEGLDKALVILRTLMNADADEKWRRRLLDYEQDMLVRMGLESELRDHFNSRIREAQEELLRALHRKAAWQFSQKMYAESVDSWQSYKNAAIPLSADWFAATAFLARAGRESGDHAMALKGFRDVVSGLEEAHEKGVPLRWPCTFEARSLIMVEAAECCILLGDIHSAKALIENARRNAHELDADGDRTKAELKKRIEERIEECSQMFP